jgi:hypothetical protein
MKGSAVRVRASASSDSGVRGSWCDGRRAPDPGGSPFKEALRKRISRRFSLRPGVDGERSARGAPGGAHDGGEGSMLGLMFLAWLVWAVVIAVNYRR